MRIVITITDEDNGGVHVDCSHKTAELLDFIKGRRGASGIGAATSACMYAMGMLTWAAARSREMGRTATGLIVLPPGVRS